MWKIVFNPGNSPVVVDKEGGLCQPQEWAPGFSSVVDPLIAAEILVKTDLSTLDIGDTNPDVILVAERVDELNKKSKKDSSATDSSSTTEKKGK